MELNLKINIFEINISKFNPALKEENDLSDYYYCHCEQGLEGAIHPSEYYHKKHCKEVFMYIDHLESCASKTGIDLSWEWRAIRDGRAYFLAISFDVCNDIINECKNIVNNVFLQNFEQIKDLTGPIYIFRINAKSWG